MKKHFQAAAILAFSTLTLAACQDMNLGLDCGVCEQRSTQFFQHLSQGQTHQAFAALGSARNRDRARWDRTATETNKLLREDGPVLGFEQLGEKQVGSRLLEYKYLLYQESNLTRWSLYYYNSRSQGWLLVNINGTPEHSQF